MIRRKALMDNGVTPCFVLGVLLKIAANGDETMVAVCEAALDGKVYLMPIETIRFVDGSPDAIPVIA